MIRPIIPLLQNLSKVNEVGVNKNTVIPMY